MTMTKQDLIKKVSSETGLTRKECMSVIDNLFEIFKSDLSDGNPVMISGFGKWSVSDKKERTGRNPQTGDPITIAARKVITFKPSSVLRKDIP